MQVERAQQLLENPAASASHPTAGAGLARAGRGGWAGTRLAGIALPLGIVALAAVLRLWTIEADAQNPFYDAAVRSMGLSWHNFFFGALTPEGAIAIDKPPVDLWLQVASTKLLGFNRAALALPESLGGIAAVGLLYGAVAQIGGRLAGALAALALAVLPVAVLTSRSDTMDSLMSALLVAALWAAVVAVRHRRARWVLASAALVGVAFNVKLTQALIPLPALALLWWLALPRRRIALAAGATGTLVAVAMAWAFVASLTPASQRPEPMGSHHTGSIYRAIFLFNGLERVAGSSQNLTPIGYRSAPGPTRLVNSAGPRYASLVGLELVAGAALLAGAALAAGGPPAGSRERVRRLATAAVVMWLATGWVLFSFMKRLEPRYLEAMSPAVAACIGLCGGWLWRAVRAAAGALLYVAALAANAAFAVYALGVHNTGVLVCLAASAVAILVVALARLQRVAIPSDGTHPVAAGGARGTAVPRTWRAALLAAGSLALLAAPAAASVELVESHAGDANPGGGGEQYSAYLRAHQGSARYEVAATNPMAVVGLIAQDGRPVLILRSVDGVLVSVGRLERLVNEGALRYAIVAHPCSAGRHCTPTTAWTVRHAVKVRPGLYRYTRG